jgi:hypothetical protein
MSHRIRRTATVALAVAAALLGAATSANANAGTHHPWVPFPQPSFDLPAGDYCAFPIHADPTVDQVRVKTIAEFPDGSPKRQLATGELKFRMTNTASGSSVIVDASGSAVFVFFPDGSRVWHVIGPVLELNKEGTSNIPKGVWTVDGIYDIHFSPTNFKTVTIFVGSVHDVCADLA